MINTAAKDILQVYGFDLKEAYNDIYTFENNKGDKVIFEDVRDPMFKIIENKVHKSHLNQVNFDDLRTWLVQNQSASKSVVETYSWFKDFLNAMKPDPTVIGAELANKTVVALFSAAALVFGGAIARGIADRVRRIGEKPIKIDMDDAIALIEQARNKLLKEGTKEQRREFEKKVEEILHPYAKKSDSKAPRSKFYSESELEGYSFKDSVIDALKTLRDLSADFIEKAVIKITEACGDVTGTAIGKSAAKNIYNVNDIRDRDVMIANAADMVDKVYKSIPDVNDQKVFAKRINDIVKSTKDKKPWDSGKGPRKYYSQLTTENGIFVKPKLETYAIRELLINHADELKLTSDFIEDVTSKYTADQIVDAVKKIIEEGGVSEEFVTEFNNLI